MKTTYELQAESFLKKHNTVISIIFKKYDYHFENDTDKRDIYQVILSRGDRSFTFDFGQSIAKSGFKFRNIHTKKVIKLIETNVYLDLITKGQKMFDFEIAKRLPFPKESADEFVIPEYPTIYNVLACLTKKKNDPGTFEDFCSDFGYSTDSMFALNTFKAVELEYMNLCTLFSTDEMKELAEIDLI